MAVSQGYVNKYNQKAIGERIRLLRKMHRHTQKQLALIMNISNAYMSQIEKGTRNASVPMLIAIACEYQISLDYIVFGREAKYSDTVNGIYDGMIAELDEVDRQTAVTVIEALANRNK